ncbi:TATA box-binding protein-associated factor [Tieghemostelium lacteum]|uniref:B-related factor 1 n=1 Tax=Tieghemostelium lacteum TaxID=361077 RepID=A0A151ZCM0_TIELA|nr:TATA box-binding protein-associated factor [Tieghemostelium lacteum]|eukprot:KYQ91681.1 TATA box-binding protein-associated factor [Tieghemostelium lacteum]
MAKNRVCVCGNSSNFDSSGDGSIVCMQCGNVLESSNIVSEVQFTESSTIMGNFVSNKSTRYRSLGRDSRELSLENARRKLEEISAPLKIRQHHIESAQRSFELAMEHNFTKGRRTKLVVAACLYSVCRREKTPHLLIDFSEILQVNVFVLANTFLQLIKLLNLRLPIVDPSIYIQRFTQSLEFGDKTNAVAHTANKLVARMKRDWMSVGRKPSGICGAALYLASKIHGFKRTLKEIIHVVKVGEITLLRRLDEFQKTPAATLKFDEFDNIELEEECDPPSFIRARKLELKELKSKEEMERKLKKLDDDDEDFEEQEEEQEEEPEEELKQLEQGPKKKSTRKSIDDNSSVSSRGSNSSASSNRNTNNNNNNDKKRKLKSSNSSNGRNSSSESEKKKLKINENGSTKLSDSDDSRSDTQSQNLTDEERELNELTNEVERSMRENENLFNIDNQDGIESIPSFFEDGNSLQEYLSQPLPSLSSGKFTYPVLPEGEREVDPSVFEPNDNLEGLSDDEINNYIEHDKETIKKKEIIWTNINKEWIIKDAEKQKELEEDIKAGRPPRKKKSNANNKKAAETAAKAAEEELKKRIRNTKLIEKFGLKLPLFDSNASTAASSGNIVPTQQSSQFKKPTALRPIESSNNQSISNNNNSSSNNNNYYEPEEHTETSGSLLSQKMANYDYYSYGDDDDY